MTAIAILAQVSVIVAVVGYVAFDIRRESRKLADAEKRDREVWSDRTHATRVEVAVAVPQVVGFDDAIAREDVIAAVCARVVDGPLTRGAVLDLAAQISRTLATARFEFPRASDEDIVDLVAHRIGEP